MALLCSEVICISYHIEHALGILFICLVSLTGLWASGGHSLCPVSQNLEECLNASCKSLSVSTVGFGFVLDMGFFKMLKLLLWVVFIDCVGVGLLIATLMW